MLIHIIINSKQIALGVNSIEKAKGQHADAVAGEFIFKDFNYRGDYDSADCSGILF